MWQRRDCPSLNCSAHCRPRSCHTPGRPLRKGGADGFLGCYHRSVGTSSAAPKPAWLLRLEEFRDELIPWIREVVPGLYQVRTRGSRVYLVVDERITIIDTGSPGSGPRIVEALRALGRSPDEVETIVITHYHIDHVGGLPELQRFLPARTAVHAVEAPYIVSDDPLPNPFRHPLLARLTEPFLLRQDPGAARVDLALRDGDELPGLGGMRIVHAPGHTAGSISIYFPERGVLLVGDAMQYRFGRLMLPNRLFTQDMRQAAESIRKLAELDYDTLCFSHFRPILRHADKRVRELARSLAVSPP